MVVVEGGDNIDELDDNDAGSDDAEDGKLFVRH